MNPRDGILVVGDTPASLAHLVETLTTAGYDACPADNCESAPAQVANNRPGLILLDIRTVGTEGLDVCRRLKAAVGTDDVPIVVIGAVADGKDWAVGLQAGASDLIAKPFQPEELLSRVSTHLSLKRAETEVERQAAALRQATDRLQSEIVERQRLESELRRNLDGAQRARRAVLSVLEDQEQAESAAREKAYLLSESQRLGRVGSWMWDLRGPIVWSDELYGLCGVSQETFRPTTESLLGLIHPDDRPAIQQWMAACAAGEKPGELEFRVAAPDGTTRVLLGRGDLVCETSHQPAHVAGTAQDITERKRAEEERAKLESQLRQAQKMESVGRLAGGVAHDFNNMLGVILGHAQLAISQVDPALPLHADLAAIRDAANRAAGLTSQLLAFARKQTVVPRIVDLNAAVEGVLTMLRRLIGEQIDLRWLPGECLWPVKVDPAQIDQILTNLCVNARDAISGTGTITIATGTITIDQAYCAAHPWFVPGEYARLTVTDDGCGIEEAVLPHLFEPFFTTKGAGRGTGLGLSTVYGIVKQNSGFVSVETNLNQGSTFTVFLPHHRGTAEPARPELVASEVRRGRETILLVEDEQAVLKLTTRLLEQQGHTVLAASTAEKAMALAREHIGDISLLITDVIMPEMNGRILAKNLLSLYPNLKHLFISGYTSDVIVQNGVIDEGVHFLQKPFSDEGLAAAVRGALDAVI